METSDGNPDGSVAAEHVGSQEQQCSSQRCEKEEEDQPFEEQTKFSDLKEDKFEARRCVSEAQAWVRMQA